MSRHQRSVEGAGAAVDGARTRDATRPTLEAGIVRQLIGEQSRRRDRCVYCGYPSPNRDGVCVAHADLGGSVELTGCLCRKHGWNPACPVHPPLQGKPRERRA